MDAAERAIAIVGMGAILPDALNVPAFWDNLRAGRYSITETPGDRWAIADYYDPDPNTPDKTYSKIGGWVRGFAFDWKKFRIPPKVVAAMDESQQWAISLAAQALDDYGYPQRPLDTERTAVILGTAMGGEQHYVTTRRIIFPEYAHALEASPAYAALPKPVQAQIHHEFHAAFSESIPAITEDSMPGELANILSGRVANVFNLRGANFVTDAACASSLAALASACELLNAREADAVITGGVDRNMGIQSFVKFCKIGALSGTGTRPFGKGADGFVMGEGGAVFLLKRLADAEHAGDRIYAVVRGVGASSDGKGKGITAPNPIGPQLATRRAWENAGLDPASAVMVEAHGTSTRVGDVVEVEALTPVFNCAPRQSIALGSVKSNLGHLKAAAGAAGLLKTVLALHHKLIPPTLNARTPNPDIPFEQSPFYLIHEPRELSARTGVPRRAGVSAYGFGGTNFHVVLEEHVPGTLTEPKVYAAAAVEATPLPPRGILALGAETPQALNDNLNAIFNRVQGGYLPPAELPQPDVVAARERLLIDFGDRDELLDRIEKARKAMAFDSAPAWKALQAQGIFRGHGVPDGKLAFLFPGQGSQYLNMGRALAKFSPIIAQVFAEADRVMTPILGKPLTEYIFLDSREPEALKQAELALQQTAVTQPAVLTLDTALYKLLAVYGFKPDMLMGHSLGEYAALIAAGIMPFADALEAAAARGAEMTKVSVGDNGWMAAVMAPVETVQATLKEIDGYVVAANINARSQCVIGGSSKAVEQAITLFQHKGFEAQRIPVSHAFHTRIVAPASVPLRQVLDRLHITPPQLPLVANVTGDFYPQTVDAIKDLMQQQIASPVQWVKGLETLYAAGTRTFVEVGPKKALKSFTDDVLAEKADVLSLFTNHPKVGELPTFNQALCGLYAAGYGAGTPRRQPEIAQTLTLQSPPACAEAKEITMKPSISSNGTGPQQMVDLLSQALAQLSERQPSLAVHAHDRNEIPPGSVVISGTGLGLPGAEKAVMDPENAQRILRGEQFIDLIPERFRRLMLDKQITRLVKAEDGSGHFETLTNPSDIMKLAGRPGRFDLAAEYGVPEKLIEALDITSQLAMAAGLDALREAGIPLVQTFKKTSKGTYLPDRWLLPEALRDETGVIFASAFPGGDRFADEFSRYYTYQNRRNMLALLEELRQGATDSGMLTEIDRRAAEVRGQLEREPYAFDRRFLFRVLAMGHSQFAEYIGARGPNTQVNAACASTTQALSLAEDWVRDGRARRVIVLAADDPSGDHLMEWMGAGFLATGAVATDDCVAEAALPFDRRRHGTLMGMGACALVIESEDAVRERGMRGIVEMLASETFNSAYHGTRLAVEHIAQVMDRLVTSVERRFGLHRQALASQMVFMSHETFTPARGGSAAAEVAALRHVFGEAVNELVVANTKGFTGHPFGVGIEDVIALKILEYGIVPPVPNYKEVDPELGRLNLSRGGRYPVQYALHLAAGFGSQIAMTFTRRIPGSLDRKDSEPAYRRWLADISGCDRAETEVVKRVLRIRAAGAPPRAPVASGWQYGTGPTKRSNCADVVRAPLLAETPVPSTVAIPARAMREPIAAPVPEIVKPEPAMGRSEPAAKPQPKSVETAAPTVELAVQAPVESKGAALDDISERVLNLVAARTGYPREMLDLDLDLEADLGIDTVKQAETFAAIREQFSIPRQESLTLRDYHTLAQAIQYVRDHRSNHAETMTVPQTAPGNVKVVTLPVAAPMAAQPSMSGEGTIGGNIQAQVLQLVAGKTGYPMEMLDLDLDLEADLGIDTVKQAETFAAIREQFHIPRVENLKLRDYPTLAHVVDFVRQQTRVAEPVNRIGAGCEPQKAAAPLAARNGDSPAQTQPPEVQTTQAGLFDAAADQVLRLVAEKTGYPPEMLDTDLDLEADLGIDTVKQAEIFSAIRAAFDIPKLEKLKLRDYPTLGHVITFVRQMRAAPAQPSQPSATTEVPVPIAPVPAPAVLPRWSIEDANRIARRVPVPVLRPALDVCVPTGVTLDAHSRVILALDSAGVGEALAKRLQALGVTTLLLDEPLSALALDGRVKAWLSEGPIQGVYWLPALDAEPELDDMDLELWREANRIHVKNLYTVMRALYDSIGAAGSFLMVVTRLGGLHGYGPEGATAPLGGAVTGFAKAYQRERADVLVKAVDVATGIDADICAENLLNETLRDPAVVEVGLWNGNRFSIALQEQAAADGSQGMLLDKNTVFVVTGAAGGITSAIIGDLATASSGTFYLLDLVSEPNKADPHFALFRTSKDELKQRLIEEAKARGERPTPVQIDKQLFAVERAEAALRAIESVCAAGGTASYHSVNLLDGKAVEAVVAEIRTRHGRMDVLIHAAGLEISRALPDKDPIQFDHVFDVKADGFFNLLHACRGMPIGATVAFSSIAGRFGNSGQTDYSAANDLLCKVTSSLRRSRPETRSIVIDWTAWGGIGMATRGSIPKIMEAAGIDMLPPECGVPTVRRELTASAFRGELVVAGRLGTFMADAGSVCGIDLNLLNARLAARDLPLIGRITRATLAGTIEAETALDPEEQPFLRDHRIDGTPLLPAVMGTETFAQFASALAPGYRIAAVEHERFELPFKFYRMRPQTLLLSAVIEPWENGDLLAHCVLKSAIPLARPELPAQEKEHFTANVRLTRALPSPSIPPFVAPRGVGPTAPQCVEHDAIYRVFFHGPSYQVLSRVEVCDDHAVGSMALALPPDFNPAGGPLLMAPRLIELCLQTAGIWQFMQQGLMALPLALDAVRVFRPEPANGAQLSAWVQALDHGAQFNACVIDAAGNIYVELRGYRTVTLPGTASLNAERRPL